MADQSTNSSRPSTSPVLIAVIVMALAGLVGLNVMANKAQPKSEEEREAEQKAAASSPAPAASPVPVASNSTASVAPGSLSLSDPNSLVMMGAGGVLGAQDAKREVVVGFSWTPAVQSDPSKVSAAVDALQKALGNQAHVKVVNVDDQLDVPEGISLGGKVIVPADGSGAISPSAIGTVKQALSSAP